MIVGTLQVRLLVRESRSLKDKRRVVKSLKDRIRNRFNVSVAEVDDQDALQTAVLGMALVTNERRFADQVFQQILSLVRATPGAEVCSVEMDF